MLLEVIKGHVIVEKFDSHNQYTFYVKLKVELKNFKHIYNMYIFIIPLREDTLS